MAKNQVLKFEGDIRAYFIDPGTGARTPVIPDASDIFGNMPLEASAQVFSYEAGDEVKVVSKRVNRYNQTLYSETEPGTTSMSLTLVAVPPALLARVFYGSAAEVSITGAAVSNEPVTFSAQAPAQALAHRYLAATPAPTVTDSSNATTYVDGVDYVIDAHHGRIRRLPSGSIGDTDTVHVSYTYASVTLTEFRGGVRPQQSLYISGYYKNRADGSEMNLEVFHWNATSDGEVDFFSSEPITVTLKGDLITPQGQNEPYRVTLKAAA